MPTSNHGRVFIMLWTCFGLAITGIVAGNLTSMLVSHATVIHTEDFPQETVFGNTKSDEQLFGKLKFPKFKSGLQFNSTIDMIEKMKEDGHRFVLIERNELEFSLAADLKKHGLGIYKAYDNVNQIGARYMGQLKKLLTCSQNVVRQDNGETVKKATQTALQNKDSSNHVDKADDEFVPIVQWNAPIFQAILTRLLILLVAILFIGGLWEFLKKKCFRKILTKIYPESKAKADRKLKELQDFGIQFIDEFNEVKNRMNRFGEDMVYEHGQQVLELFKKLALATRLNLKHLNEEDLPMPLTEVLHMREENDKLVNKPKQK